VECQEKSSYVSELRLLWAGSLFGSLLLAGVLGAVSVHAGSTGSTSLAEVEGVTITAEDVDRALGIKLVQVEEQLFQLRRQELNALIERHLLSQEAARRGMTVALLLDAEVTAKVALVSEKEVDDFYQANRTQFSGDEAEIRKNLRASFQVQKFAAQRERFLESLRSHATIVDRLQLPPTLRIDVSVQGAPIRGAADAPVTLVEFSDFHCPFCKRVQPTLTQLLDRYPGKVKLAFRDFPLGQLHPQARRAAEAARCAQDQGKFWEYHDILFANAPQASAEDINRYAQQIGLDVSKFNACLFQSVHHEAVQRDIDEATKLGMTGTPAFFINGRFLNGAQPLEKFVQIIEEELTRSQANAAVSMRKD
jgi:protein-disulfide isomerase